MAKIKISAAQKKIAIGAVVGLLVIAISATALIKLTATRSDGENDTPKTVEKVQIEAAELFSNGDTEGGFSYYDENIEAEKDDSNRQELLIQKSIYASIAKQYDLAIDTAKQADAIGSNASTVRALAEAYAASGDKKQAIVHYKKLLEMTPATDKDELRRGPSIEEIIKGLEK